jgi:Putative prokaryotic signal transducing protein
MANRAVRAREERPDPNEKLVKIFDTEQESEALVVRGLLESAGIDADMTSIDAPQDTFPGVGGTVILVREEDADEARRLIEDYRQSAADEDETAEIDLNEPPPKE